jgi:hypothetical protein
MKRALLAAVLLSGCTQTLSEADCAKYKDRLRVWAEKKGRVDPTAADAFMKSCTGASISRSTAKCLDNAGDETTFVKCLE